MEEIKNVIVEQTDIYDIIRSFNDYFLNQQQMFDETDRLINEEESKYQEWNNARFNSADYANYPAFNRQTFKNKRIWRITDTKRSTTMLTKMRCRSMILRKNLSVDIVL